MKIASNRRFQDEWIARSVREKLGIAEAVIEDLRGEDDRFLAEALLRKGLCDTAALSRAVATSYGLAYSDPKREEIDKLALGLVTEAFCRRRQLVPMRIHGEEIEVAMANPLDADSLADLRSVTGRTPKPFYCLPGRLSALLESVYDNDKIIFDLLKKVEVGETVELLSPARADIKTAEVHAPVIRLVNAIIVQAVHEGASDIHIEHEEARSCVRLRVDGVLHQIMVLPRSLAAGAVAARIKIMADLDIANRMRPQDGRAALRVGEREVSLRVSTLPTPYGEKVVLRLLDRRDNLITLEGLGILGKDAARLKEIIKTPQGLILVTGPTGSGKTTTLYALLNLLRGPDVNIVTIEDPIEYKMEGITQVQVKEKQGLGFAETLRSVLRQDPDIILVGEIRDPETAAIAVQAAMTGHLVFSTLHTNDSVSAISRLIDMGVEAYQAAPALRAILSQRLVRRLCPDCRVPQKDSPYFMAVGCPACMTSGYRGRLALLETLTLPEAFRARLVPWPGESVVRDEALHRGVLRGLASDAFAKLTAGETSLEEALPYISQPMEVTKMTPPPAASPRRRVLVTDDDPIARRALRGVLEGQGYQVDEAADGIEALEILDKIQTSLLLCDLHMPRLNGHDLIRRLRQDPRTASLPAIMLTVDTEDRSQQEAFEAGADDYIVKPFKAPLVVARVMAALRRAS
jgi:type IV pilus assembly protein PilB